MPGSNSAFIPTINAITTSQDLQWMVQPTVITSMSNPYTRSHPYGHHHLTNGPGLLGHNALTRPGVIRSIGDARGRRKRDEQVRGGKKIHSALFEGVVPATASSSFSNNNEERVEIPRFCIGV